MCAACYPPEVRCKQNCCAVVPQFWEERMGQNSDSVNLVPLLQEGKLLQWWKSVSIIDQLLL